ncbi:SAM-dependent DNA methyltransferase [Candidatus Bipolaricaulota bacterium]|nr:SAM-dependent DNA methyltransferase [Candidatus Bipolaricaulota bacterium]
MSRIVEDYARKLARALAAVPPDCNEAELRHRVQPILQGFAQALGLTAHERDEYVVAEGTRADAVFDRLVIEFKRPGALASGRALAAARDQVAQYMQSIAQREGHRRLGGVVFDGRQLVFVRLRDGHVRAEPPRPADEATLADLLWWLAGLTGTALTAENLARDFGIDHPRSREAIAALYSALTRAVLADPEGMVAKLFQQWKLFFSEAIDYQEAFGGRKLDPLKRWVAKAGLEIGAPEEAERFFFALHTYFALLVKLIAWLALSRHLGPRIGAPLFEELERASSSELSVRLRAMEQGGVFREFGIENLLEGDFFAWYLYAYGEAVEAAVQALVSRLEEYDPTTLRIDPDETRDLLKKLYHYLLPRQVRHHLGEYYTPDWLAQRLLEQVDQEFFDDHEAAVRRQRPRIPKLRWLDPACGSGTFLVLLIKRYRELGEQLMIPEADLLNAVLENVVGFDINPLAVITARVNYLLALGDLIERRGGPITIPVYLADSVLLPEMGHDLESSGLYQVRTSVGVFAVPQVVFAHGRLSRFCSLLEDVVRAEEPPAAFAEAVTEGLELSEGEKRSALGPLRVLCKQLAGLHRKGLDGLWARLLLNNLAPLTVGEFDYVVGNPPWVNWEHLPDGYRDATKKLWDRYGLFPHAGMDVILGKGKKDIAMLMAYVAMDRFLKPKGKLGFVITQSLFKTAGAGQGFRRFQLGENGEPLRVLHVDDMVELNPFESASNRTAVMVILKGQETRYPVPYTVWRKKRARFTYDSTLEEVKAATTTDTLFAVPVDPDDPTSPWLTASKPALAAVRKVLGRSDYTAHEGVNTGGANGVYWVRILSTRPDGLVVVENITEGAKREVPKVTAVIEPDLLYPLLRGRDVGRWHAEPSAQILMVQDPKTRRGIAEEVLRERYPNTWSYLERFEPILWERAAFKRYFTRQDRDGTVAETGPFYSMFDVGDYTFAPWKVVWTRIAQISAAVVGQVDGKAVIPQETITLVGCQTESEAHFIAALVNSTPFQFAAFSYSQAGGKSMGSMHVLENIRIPRYDPADPVHRALAETSQEAQEAAARGDTERLAEIEARVDSLAAQLWGLTTREVAVVRLRGEERGDEEVHYFQTKVS